MIKTNKQILENIKTMEKNNKKIGDIVTILNNINLKKGEKDRYQRIYFMLVGENKILSHKIEYLNNKIEIEKILSEI